MKEISQSARQRNRQTESIGLFSIKRMPSPDCEYRTEKCARTPFERFRRQQKIRKERIHLSLSPKKHQFTLACESQLSSYYGIPKKGKSQNGKCKSDRSVKEKQYQVVVRDSLRKMNNCRLNNHEKREQAQKRLVIQGATCSNDLIALNRRKLEQMIAQIKVNNAVLHENFDISEVVLEKNKYTRNKQSQKKVSKNSEIPFSYSPQCTSRAFDTAQFLICGPAVMQISSKDLCIENNPKVADRCRNWEDVCAVAPGQFQTFRSKSRKKTCKTEEIAKNHSPKSSRKTSPSKKGPIINGFNLHNLKGWDSKEEPEDAFFQIALH